jgi:hypothetical protein
MMRAEYSNVAILAKQSFALELLTAALHLWVKLITIIAELSCVKLLMMHAEYSNVAILAKQGFALELLTAASLGKTYH